MAAIQRMPPGSFANPFYYEMVTLLRPGVKPFTEEGLTQDIENIYSTSLPAVARHLQQHPHALHLAIDGWSNLSGMSRFAAAVCWSENGQSWRAILGVFSVGEYDPEDLLAESILEYLGQCGIADKIMFVCHDHAPYNKKVADQLVALLPNFRGRKSQVLSLSHVVGLMAKAFISFFSPPAPIVQIREGGTVIDKQTNNDSEELPTIFNLSRPGYNNLVLQLVGAKAQVALVDSNISIPGPVLADARQIMHKVSKLSNFLEFPDPSSLNISKNIYVEQNPDLRPHLREEEPVIIRPLPVEWNTDLSSIESLLRFKEPVQKITAANNHLNEYALSNNQWDLTAELGDVLQVFAELVDRFSKTKNLLVHEVMPELWSLQARLRDIRDDYINVGLSPVTRAAARAAILVYEKLMRDVEESDVYDIAVAMCPDRKLQRLGQRGHDVEYIRARVVNRFNESYANLTRGPGDLPKAGSVWAQRYSTGRNAHLEMDDIEDYFRSPLVEEGVISECGGVLAYWTSKLETRPRVARMALDYLSAPATTVDKERVFSGGPLLTYGLETKVEPSTFQAQMMIGSWFKTPLIPSEEEVTRLLENSLKLE